MKVVKHKIIETLFKRDGLRCGICKKSIELSWKEYQEWLKDKKTHKRCKIDLDIDHKIPRSKLSKGNQWQHLCNLQLTHKKCNNLKGNVLTR